MYDHTFMYASDFSMNAHTCMSYMYKVVPVGKRANNLPTCLGEWGFGHSPSLAAKRPLEDVCVVLIPAQNQPAHSNFRALDIGPRSRTGYPTTGNIDHKRSLV